MSRRTVTRPEVRVGGFRLSSIVPEGGWGGLHHQTRLNGAWEASWTIPGARTWRHLAAVAGAPVEVMFGPSCVFVGDLAEPNWDSGDFVAEGACRDGETASALNGSGEASTVPNSVADAAKARGVVSWTRIGNFGTTAVGEQDGIGGLVTIRSVFDAWAQENNSNWAIENTPARGLIIRPTAESSPSWFVTPGSGVLGMASDKRVDRLAVRYISSTTGRRATLYYAPAGGKAEQNVDLTDRGAMTTAKATSIAQTMWNDLKGKPGWTNGLTLTGGQVTTPGGVVADLALIKAGDTIRLLGVPDPRGVAHNLDVVIGDTDYDWDEDTLQLNPIGIAAGDEESTLIEVGDLAVDAMAKATSKSALSFSDYVRQGRTTCTPSNPNIVVTVAVTFSSPMPSVPKISFAPFTAANSAMQATCSNVTTTGFDLNFRRDTATATNVDWTAICLPA